ncbi:MULTISPECIES: DUF4926 domain-containing protein [Acidithiobacillus]|uniref:DUF4926 domain-containing protein n=2 Tax=Acidithiobacillus sulfuriphilus TaxID=1867749 RepID=A0A3M8QPQ1_9PROT|nr:MULTISPECIES: DUF4926 domain-containing protein [Acidithiobacillus]MBU2857837.1 DUF4926 domain-containing protein [Acidithiobacillus ferrooxidans]RNF58216.1 DUF4926 domain-containing protein [Acidithiobacillus sulfuriphilus]
MKLLDVVALVKAHPKKGLHRGQVGTIVEVLSPGVFLVEFANLSGEAYAFLTLPEGELLRLHHQPALKVA